MLAFRTTLPLIATAALCTPLLQAQQDDEKPAPVTLSQALKLGPEKLTKFTGPSEAGQDHAAILYATAKQVETEHALAQKNLEQVVELDVWRDAITQCRQSALGLASIVNGGGTMYSHGSNRNAAEVEDFLAGFAKRLPLAEGKGDPKATKEIVAAIAFLKALKPGDLGDADAEKEAKKNLADEVKRVTEFWDNLKSMISSIPAADAKAVAAFATDSLSWLKEGE